MMMCMNNDLVIKLSILFYISSILGYFYELILNYLENAKVFKGPWLPIYGIGSLFIILLNKLKNNPLNVFFASFFLSGIVEYLGAFFLLHTFKMRLWDYTGYLGNIQGFICFLSLFCFGCGGVLVIYILYPLIEKLVKKVNPKIIKNFLLIISFLFTLDFLGSVERNHI